MYTVLPVISLELQFRTAVTLHVQMYKFRKVVSDHNFGKCFQWNLNNKSGAYEVCDYKVRGADNKLVSPFIVIKDALAIEVVVKFETDACEDLTDADNSCSEDLRLGYIPANGDIERPGTSSALYEVPTVKIRQVFFVEDVVY